MRRQTTFFAILCLIAVFFGAESAEAGNPVGDFFKRVGNSIAYPQRGKSRRPGKTSAIKPSASKGSDVSAGAVSNNPSVMPGAASSGTPVMVRSASKAPQIGGRRRDVPYGVPVPNKPGFVTSPYAPTRGVVDVRGFPGGTEVKDPYTDKIFLAP